MVIKNKFNADGSFQCHKARLVTKGFSQTVGYDYTDTYSPVVKPVTIHLVLSHAISHHWPIHQIDVNNVFLNGDLNEDVYMTQPPGFTSTSPHLVCKLHKALYGLKQAPRAWFHKLSATLNSLGFHSTKSDTSLFVNFHSTYTIFILIYVDDIIITGSSLTVIQQLISTLSTCFALKDLGLLQFFLGIHVTHLSTGGLRLSQQQYIMDLLRRTNMHAAKPLPTPMQTNLRLQKDASSAMHDPSMFRSIVGPYNMFLLLALNYPMLSTRCANSCIAHKITIGKLLNRFFAT